MSAENDAWAQLVSLTDIDSEPVPISRDKFVIGRAKDCDLSLSENKLVSGRHCYLQRDENGKVWLADTSTNGTLLNLSSKIGKGNRKELQHGDEFYIVYKKNEEAQNVGYMFQNMKDLENEMEETQEYDPDIMDATVADDDCNVLDDSEKDVKESDVSTDEPPAKKQKTGKPKEKCSDVTKEHTSDIKKSAKETEKSSAPSSEKIMKSSGESTEKSSKSDADKSTCKSAGDDIEEILICMICQELMHDCVSLQPCMHTFCAGCYSDWMGRSSECPTCRMQVDRINKNHIVNNLIEAYLKEHPDKKRPEEDIADLDKKNKITKDMLYPEKKRREYDPDYSDYSDSDDDNDNDYSSTTVVTNPVINNPPMLFGFGNPVFGTVRAVTRCRQCTGYVDPQTTNQPTGILGMATAAVNAVRNVVGLGGNPGADTGDTNTGAGTTNTGATNTGAGTSGATNTDAVTTDSQQTEPAESVEAGPSTGGDFAEAKKKDDEKVVPTPPTFTCGANQNHVLCQCCLQPMPDRRQEYLRNPNDPNLPAQQCTVCYRAFCHAYWGCKKADCLGCINKFKDAVYGRKVLATLVLDNTVESDILRDYLDSEFITLNDLRDKCMENLDNKTFTCRDQARFAITSNTPLCYACALRNFKDLAYMYRAQIDKKDLPEKASKRPDCYWGKNCRTQRNKPHHAQNFSHICEQTRTT